MKRGLLFLLALPFLVSLGCGSSGGGSDGRPPLVFFQMNTGDSGWELGVTDGSSAGTKLVADLSEGSVSSNPSVSSEDDDYIFLNGVLYFAANDAIHGEELWRSDGTEEGTHIVANIAPGADYSSPNNFVLLNSTLYFLINAHSKQQKLPITHSQLWKSDGSEEGTVEVYELSDSVDELTVFKGYLYFTSHDGTYGSELWRSDGSEEGTVLFKDINQEENLGSQKAPAINESSYPRDFCVVGDTLFFTADDGVNGRELWKSDGSVAGTEMVADLSEGSDSSSFGELVALDSSLFFAFSEGGGFRIWGAGESKGAPSGNELWKSDGSEEGTVLVHDFSEGGDGGLNELMPYNGELYFSADDGNYGDELWKSDGSEGGTVLVKDINKEEVVATMKAPSNVGSDPRELSVANGLLFFTADDGLSGRELWRSDGSSEGTTMVRDIGEGPLSGDVGGLRLLYNEDDVFALFKKGIVFGANDGEHGVEPWFSDGSFDGTAMLCDCNEGLDNGYPGGT